MFARMTDAELIETSELIVTGALTGYADIPVPDGAGTRRVGVIEVETVYKGNDGTATVWLDVPQPGGLRSSSDTSFVPGQAAGLWFLHRLPQSEAAVYDAAHPQRFVPASSAGPVIEALRRTLGK